MRVFRWVEKPTSGLKMSGLALSVLVAAGLSACASNGEGVQTRLDLPSAPPVAETEPVASIDDAADDPAIWINRADPARSLILGTDKRAGLYVYTLDGAERQFLPAGRLNNVDLRQDVVVGGPAGTWRGDVAAATNRTDDTVTLFAIDMDGKVTPAGAFPSAFVEPYGLCMGAGNSGPFVVVTHKTGDLVLYQLTSSADGSISGGEIGRLKFKTQLEGCVFDDEAGVLFIGEENRGVWRADLTPGADGALRPGAPTLIDEVGGDGPLTADVEGLALYRTGPQTGYLIASSQGDYTYAVYDRAPPHAFVGSFRIGDNPETGVDGAEETDGLEATELPLGPKFPAGVLVVQDGFNRPAGSAQNFKIVDWRAVAAALSLE